MNKLLSIEEEKKFLIDFFHSEFCQYEVEKTDEFGDSVIGLDDNAYSCHYSSDIFDGNKLPVNFRYNLDENGKIICELVFTIYSKSRDGVSSHFGRLIFLAPDNERYCFDGHVISIIPVSNKYRIDILFRISEEIASQVFTIGTKVRIKLLDSADRKISHYGCSLLDWYRLVIGNVHLSDDKIDSLYDILLVCSEKRKAALEAKRKQDEIRQEKERIRQEQEKEQRRIRQEQERIRQEQEREVKRSEKAELTSLLMAIQKLNFNDFSFLKTLIESPYSIPSVAALSDYCKKKGKKHSFLREIEYCQEPYLSYLKDIKRRQRKRTVNRWLLFLFVFYVFVYVLYPDFDGVPQGLGIVMALSLYIFIGLGIYSFFLDCPKKGLPEEEIERLKKALAITDLDEKMDHRLYY